MLNVEMWHHTLHLTFLDWMCSQDTAAGSFWKEDAKQSFPSLRSVHSADGGDPPFAQTRVPLLSQVSACIESSLSAADRSL